MVERFDLSSGDGTSSAFEWGPEELDAFERLHASMADYDPGAVHAPSSSSSEPVSWRCCGVIPPLGRLMMQSLVRTSVCRLAMACFTIHCIPLNDRQLKVPGPLSLKPEAKIGR